MGCHVGRERDKGPDLFGPGLDQNITLDKKKSAFYNKCQLCPADDGGRRCLPGHSADVAPSDFPRTSYPQVIWTGPAVARRRRLGEPRHADRPPPRSRRRRRSRWMQTRRPHSGVHVERPGRLTVEMDREPAARGDISGVKST